MIPNGKDLLLLEELAEQDARWQPVLLAVKSIQAHVAQIEAQNLLSGGGVRTCPWLARHLQPQPWPER